MLPITNIEPCLQFARPSRASAQPSNPAVTTALRESTQWARRPVSVASRSRQILLSRQVKLHSDRAWEPTDTFLLPLTGSYVRFEHHLTPLDIKTYREVSAACTGLPAHCSALRPAPLLRHTMWQQQQQQQQPVQWSCVLWRQRLLNNTTALHSAFAQKVHKAIRRAVRPTDGNGRVSGNIALPAASTRICIWSSSRGTHTLHSGRLARDRDASLTPLSFGEDVGGAINEAEEAIQPVQGAAPPNLGPAS